MITTHPRFLELILQDFAILRDVLGSKARCYGFGAVIEEFEVRDAVASVFARKNIAFH